MNIFLKQILNAIFFMSISTTLVFANTGDLIEENIDIDWPVWNVEYSITSWTNTDVVVSIECLDLVSGCDMYSIDWWSILGNSYIKTFDWNQVWEIELKDNLWNTTKVYYGVVNIDKEKPYGDISKNYIDWTNSDVTVTYSCFDNTSWCDPVLWALWEYSENWEYSLEIQDAAWNKDEKSFYIENIDKVAPTYHIEYETIMQWDTTQRFKVTCADELSWCTKESNSYERPLNTSWVLTIEDNAWNITSFTYSTAKSSWDFSDRDLDWVSWSRTIWLRCRDEFSWCVEDYVEAEISEPTPQASLTVSDKAWNTVTRNYEILKIDNRKPLIFATKLTFNDYWKASDSYKLKLFAKDLWGSLLKTSKYIWDDADCLWKWIVFDPNQKINFTTSWDHTLYLCAEDNAWNIKEYSKRFKIYPWDISEEHTILRVETKDDKYANDNDSYLYTISLKDKYDNPIYDKTINNLKHDVLENDKKLFENMIDRTWEETIIIYLDSWSSNSLGEVTFNLKSASAWDYGQSFSFDIKSWWDMYIDNLEQTKVKVTIEELNSFKKPIIWKLSIIDWSATPKIWLDQEYRITLFNTWALSSVSNWILDITEETIIHKTSWHFWNEMNEVDTSFWNDLNNNIWFIWNIWALDNILNEVSISTDNIIISYRINSKNIKYYLDDFWINWCDVETLWLKVKGIIQGDWKSNITWQEKNFSDISKWELRMQIRKNAYELIENMSSWDIVNWVKYIENQDIIISWENLEYETLIVKDWNVFISEDLNTLWNKLWIIVLKDNYTISSDYNNIGNIYVWKNVEKIDALIYADWVFRSATNNWSNYLDKDLSKVLYLKWSLFTRNTIWWAVKWNTTYVLPWWEETNDFSLAEVYDLNYIRKVSNNCGIWEDYSFLIEYKNMSTIVMPLWFTMK